MYVAKEEWITMTDAAQRVGVSIAKLSRLVHSGKIKSKRDPRDDRRVLVDMEELRRYFKM